MANLKEKEEGGLGWGVKTKEYAIHEIFFVTNWSELMCYFVLQG